MDEVWPPSLAELQARFAAETVKPTHVAFYLDEITFRFNRRTSRGRGKLFSRLVQQTLLGNPVPGKELKALVPAAEAKDFDDREAWGDHKM